MTDTEITPFSFSDPREYLRAVLQKKQEKARSFSLRAWSRQLGFRTPSYLSAVLKGDRTLKPEFATRLRQNLRLTGGAAQRFELLVLRANATDESERGLYDRLLARIAPEPAKRRLRLDQFALIADWYHLVILEMMELPDFRPETAYLSKRLGGRVRPALIESALRRLVRLRLARITADGSYERVPGEKLAGDEVSSSAIRQHHLQYLEKAKLAIAEQPMEDRDVRGSVFAFRKEDIETARGLIRELHRSLRQLADNNASTDVYRFSSQLFALTEPVSE